MEKTMDKIIALAKARGFVYPGSEIYGGLANTWDYGNLGVELKNNVKRAWWQKFIQESPYNVGVDCAILMNPQTWVASGHLGSFSDPLMDCKDCKTRHRADKLIEDFTGESADGWTNEQLESFIEEKQIPCPTCGKHDFTGIRKFNMMFKTHQRNGGRKQRKSICVRRRRRAFSSITCASTLISCIFSQLFAKAPAATRGAVSRPEKAPPPRGSLRPPLCTQAV